MKARRLPLSDLHPGRHRNTRDNAHATARAAQALPAACVSIGGPFALEHHDEIIDLVRRFEAGETAADPGQRIVSVRVDGRNLLIHTSDVRLARAIGETLRQTFKGDLKFHFGETDCPLRVHWQR